MSDDGKEAGVTKGGIQSLIGAVTFNPEGDEFHVDNAEGRTTYKRIGDTWIKQPRCRVDDEYMPSGIARAIAQACGIDPKIVNEDLDSGLKHQGRMDRGGLVIPPAVAEFALQERSTKDQQLDRLTGIIAEVVRALGIEVADDANLGPGPDICAYGDERGHDTKGSRKALGAINAKLRAKVGRLERELAALSAPSHGEQVRQMVDALELAQGLLRNHGFPESDPLGLGAINRAIKNVSASAPSAAGQKEQGE